MSAEESDDGSPGNREVAYRLFAAEFDDADFEYSESDEERAPNYVITPTGARVNRVFAVGVLTEVQPAGEDILRARVADPTGTFVVYAGQYQPDAQTFLERAEPPAYVAVTGKARTFQPDDSDVVYTSIRPESLNEVEETTRDRWTVGAARQTLERVGTMATAMGSDARGDALHEELLQRGAPEGLAAGIPLALDHYETTPGYLAAVRELALSAAELVAGDREEVESLALAPHEGGEADREALAATADLADAQPVETSEASGTTTAEARDDAESTERPEAEATDEAATAAQSTPETDATDVDATSTSGTTEAEAKPEPEPVPDDETAADSSEGDAAETVETATEAGDTDEATASEDTAAEEPAAGEGSAELGDFDGEFELDEDEREEIKSEFGTEFTSGTDVDEPGEAGIDTPDPEPEATDAEPGAGSEAVEESVDSGDESTTTASEATADEADVDVEETDDEGDVDVEDAVMDAMSDLDDGDGADRAAVIERVSDEHGVPADAVEDAIQDALMNGRCYEPGDGLLKPI